MLTDATPTLPEELDDRAADIWEPLLAIVELAGGDLLAQAQAAALSLSTGDDREDNSLGVMLLSDIHAIFKDKDRVFSHQLVTALLDMKDAPWGDIRGWPINERTLAKMLSPFGIKPHQIRIGAETKKGYLRSDFADAWARYVTDPPNAPPTETTETTETPPSTLSIAAPHG